MISTTFTLCILLIGIAVVIGGVLVLKLHAFLALILGALTVAVLTPRAAVEEYALKKSSFSDLKAEGERLQFTVGKKQFLKPQMACVLLRPDAEAGKFRELAVVRVTNVVKQEPDQDQSAKDAEAIIESTSEDASFQLTELQDDDLLVTLNEQKSASSLASQTIAARVATGFGNTCLKIGILIAMASIIGKCLLDSGAADRIVRSMLGRFGEKGAPASFIGSGFLLGIPVFFDTVFYLMIPLGKAMRMRTGKNYLLFVLTIVAGGTMAHSLVPPTPGPLFVAEELGVDIGLMILLGCFVGLFTAGFGYLYATILNRYCELPLRESPDISLAELEAITHREESDLPPLWLSLLPILLPVILIGGNTVLQFLEGVPERVTIVAKTLGDKNMALVISATIALLMLAKQKKNDLKALADSTQQALSSGGVIILITAGGGAFGAVLQQTGVANLISDLEQNSPTLIITLGFLVTTAIRTAQGSATVAMITTVGIFSGIAASGDLGFHPVYLALAIGCGSKPIAWMNDSGFWVITKMSGMTEAEGLKYVTPMTTCMGLVGLAVILITVQIDLRVLHWLS